MLGVPAMSLMRISGKRVRDWCDGIAIMMVSIPICLK